jgi:hypothetical protein
MRPMTVNDRDALDHAIVKMRGLLMATRGADSLMDQDEAASLEVLAADTLAAFEAVQGAVEGAPIAAA